MESTTAPTTRERILHGASRAFTEHGIRRARMHHVCAEADCSRATAYRHFQDKEALIAAYAQWQLERQLAGLKQHLEAQRDADLAVRLITSVSFAIDAITSDPAVTPFFREDAVGIVGTIPARTPSMMVTLFEFVQWMHSTATGLDAIRDGLRWDWAAEWLMRVVLSFATVDGPERDAETRRQMLEAMLLPVFLQGPAAPPPNAGAAPSSHRASGEA